MSNLSTLMRLDEGAIRLDNLADEIEREINELEQNGKANDVAAYFFALREAYTKLDASRKKVYAQKDRIDKHLLPAKMEAIDVDLLRMPDLGRSFSKQTKYSASFIDKAAGYEWLREIGSDALITETVNAGTLASFVKNRMIEEGLDPPEDIVNFKSYHVIGVTKYTPKKT